VTVTGPIKRHSAPNKRSKFWLYSRFVFVLQDLPQLTGNYINRSPLYSVRTSPQCRPTVSNSGASKATRVAVAISLSLSLRYSVWFWTLGCHGAGLWTQPGLVLRRYTGDKAQLYGWSGHEATSTRLLPASGSAFLQEISSRVRFPFATAVERHCVTTNYVS